MRSISSIKLPLQLILAFSLIGCCRVVDRAPPPLVMPKHPKEIQREHRSLVILPDGFSVSPFAPLSSEESASEWGKEYRMGLCFADDFDLYRAITQFKRAIFLNPPEERLYEMQYATLLAYFLGEKYREVVYLAESTPLGQVSNQFPAFHDLVLILHQSYKALGQEAHATSLLQFLGEPEQEKITFLSLVEKGDLQTLTACAEERPYLHHFIDEYASKSKSIRTAQLLNALCPGAGYAYVGQPQTATTAFLVNALFMGASAYFFADGNIPAGILTLSLEGGWYFGGIYGAGLAAQTYNEQLYSQYADRIGKKEQFYPKLMLNYSF